MLGNPQYEGAYMRGGDGLEKAADDLGYILELMY
jgi:hypothetical protein